MRCCGSACDLPWADGAGGSPARNEQPANTPGTGEKGRHNPLLVLAPAFFKVCILRGNSVGTIRPTTWLETLVRRGFWARRQPGAQCILLSKGPMHMRSRNIVHGVTSTVLSAPRLLRASHYPSIWESERVRVVLECATKTPAVCPFPHPACLS